MDADALRILRVMECPGVGHATLRKIVERYRGAPPEDFFGRDPGWYRVQFGFGPALADTLFEHTRTQTPRLSSVVRLPIQVATPFCPSFPIQLLRLRDSPPVLILWGNYHMLIESDARICVLSSSVEDIRAREGIKSAWAAAVRNGWTIVAGHNRPVYQWGLLSAKRAGTPSIMVLDRGLLAAFDEDLRRDPVPAARIWGYGFDLEHSVALSTFRLWDPWIGANARRRDEIVAALADVIVAIGVRPGGTMHRVCREALERGQTVLADGPGMELLGPCGAMPWTGVLPETVKRRTSGADGGPESTRNG